MPSRVGRYQLCFEVASGGMATVYLARAEGPEGFDKLVALKQIHAHLAKDPGFVEMFLDEARLASRIQHPNVCSVIDFGEAEGSYYLTMEFLLGEPLGTVMRAARKAARALSSERPRTPFDTFALRVVADAAEGLHAAHELTDAQGEPLNVVHRDVSPQNLFVTYNGGVRVVDFGIARAENRVHKTQTGHVKGNFAYMAPEQMSAQHVDRRADIWSLGVILHELLAGRRLFKRESLPETVQAVTVGPIPPLTEADALIDTELMQIVDRCLQRDRDRRYATARELSRDLNEYLARRGVSVGMEDVAEWIQTLCPGGLAEKRQLVQLALQADTSVPRTSRKQEEQSHSTMKSMRVEIPEDAPATELAAAATKPPAEATTVNAELEEPAEPRGKRRGLWAGVALLAIGAVVAGVWA
ncbi:MAG: serine/threonine-protein kinase, partial [Myxococcales bacterium]|nr:serine/threonine-protein kinase [Myxococcales bacterium]